MAGEEVGIIALVIISPANNEAITVTLQPREGCYLPYFRREIPNHSSWAGGQAAVTSLLNVRRVSARHSSAAALRPAGPPPPLFLPTLRGLFL